MDLQNKFNRVLSEGIHDKNLFKAVFMAGGPGSGKSFVANLMFLRGDVAKNIKFGGLNAFFVNSDDLYAVYSKRFGVPMKFGAEGSDLYKQQQDVRKIAKDVISARAANWINGMLPMIIDGTGRDPRKIKGQSDTLESNGYDTYMILVKTSLDVARRRNERRERTVVDSLLVQWNRDVDNLVKMYYQFFKENFFVIEQDEDFDIPSPEFAEFANKIQKLGRKLIESPLNNPIGKRMIEMVKSAKGTNLSDIGVTKGQMEIGI